MEILIIVVILIFLVAPIIESIRKWYANREYRELSKLTQEERELIDNEVKKLVSSYKKSEPFYDSTFDKITSLYASYPHGFAYLAMKHLYVRIGSVNMPTSYFDEQGNADSTLFLASCTMKYLKDIKELSHSQMVTLLSFSDDFEAKEKYVLQQLEYENICLEFNIEINNDKYRNKYYEEFLSQFFHISKQNVIKRKEFCLKNIEYLDSYISQEEDRKRKEDREFYEDWNTNLFNKAEYNYAVFKRIKESVSLWRLKVKGIPYYFFYHYYPTRFTDISNASRNVRGLIYDFKDGKRHGNVVNILSQKLRSTFNKEDFKHLCFVCIPASTKSKNDARYESFSNDLCYELGMMNGFKHIRVIEDKISVREGGSFVSSNLYDIDTDFFRDKNVILFDDVVTRGRSMQVFKELLENNGATVICALSIGRTYSDYYGDHREPHPWTNEL